MAATASPGTVNRRGFIRHPVEIPIEVKLDAHRTLIRRKSDDVGQGGLRYRSTKEIARGTSVQVRIPLVEPAFEASARVAWCEKRDGGFDVGVAFLESEDRFAARMIEQVCHIEQFRRAQVAGGRALSAQEAAREWVRRFASKFPGV